MKEKPTKKSITASLAMRIFLINALILVVPLLMHSVISYRDEYEIRLKDRFQLLKILGTNRARLIEDLFRGQETILRVVEQELVDGKRYPAGEKLQTYFDQIVSLAGASNLFYLELTENGDFACKAYAVSCDEETKNLKKFLGKKRFEYTRFFPEENRALFYVGTTVFSPKTGNPIGLLIIADSAEKLVRGFASLQDAATLNLSFVTESHRIIASSSPYLWGKLVGATNTKKEPGSIPLVPVPGVPGGFFLEERLLAVPFSVPGIPGYMLLDLPLKDLKNLHIDRYIRRLVFLLFLILVVGGGIALLCTIRMARPLRSLLSHMNGVQEGKVQARYQKDPLGFEINTLGENFNAMIESLLREQKLAQKERSQKELYEKELLFGQDIQENLLRFDQKDLPIDVASYYASSKEVGGDFYDLFYKGENTLYFSLADVSGKGVSACLYALGLRSSLRTSVATAPLDLALQRANHLFSIDAKDTGMFASIWAAYYEMSTQTLTYLNAGHWPAILRRKEGKILSLDTGSPSIGIEENSLFVPEKIHIGPGDLLLLYSDGIIEMRGARGEMYGKKRLEQCLKDTEDLSAKEVMSKIIDDYDAFRGEQKPEDDVTILLLLF
ncbi:MAG: PP2C family protein-serine/threonine phosphatase [Chlamydiota bacterium]